MRYVPVVSSVAWYSSRGCVSMLLVQQIRGWCAARGSDVLTGDEECRGSHEDISWSVCRRHCPAAQRMLTSTRQDLVNPDCYGVLVRASSRRRSCLKSDSEQSCELRDQWCQGCLLKKLAAEVSLHVPNNTLPKPSQS